ncbi:glutamate--tRNA ligase [Candidatus Calescamantes bacterium]|nr:glutamate--tRNA ligase [Candidatus Calescamantes bacterium]
MVRVRFAPSPTGYLHIGGARTALFNWLFAKHQGGRFILRIEDTDIARSRKEVVEKILTGLRWLGIEWDEGPGVGGDYGPYFQSQRIPIYQKYINQLLEEGKAYLCYCTPEELEERRKEMIKRKEVPRYDGRCRNLTLKEREKFEREKRKAVVRFKWESSVEGFEDKIRGYIDFSQHQFDDFVIQKTDGTPTYNFACIVDDHLMKITHIIRGEDHITNTPRQLALYRAFGWEAPQFAHLPLILGPDRSRLSKRHGATDLLEYREMGYLPEALLNYLALLGWYPGSDEEIFNQDEIIRRFTLENISKRNAIFNIDKLDWMNSQYIQRMPMEKFKEICWNFLEKEGIKRETKEKEWWERFFTLYKVRIKTFQQLVKESAFFFNEKYPFEEKAVKKILQKEYVPELLTALKEEIKNIEPFTVENIEKVLRESCEKRSMSGRKFIHPLRVALSGKMVSPPIFDVIFLIGREKCIERIDRTLTLLEEKNG